MNESIDNRYMELRVGEQLYAIHLLTVREVIQQPEITAIPNSPADFEGMMNLRGQIMGVFNVHKKLGAKNKPAGERHLPSVVVVVECQGTRLGVIVDEVTRVVHPTPDAVKPAPLKEEEAGKQFVESVIQMESDLVLVLNLDQLLNVKKYKADLKAA